MAKFDLLLHTPDTPSKKLTVLFPGMGYTIQKPLLYYSDALLDSLGYDVIRIKYDRVDTDIPTGIRQAYEMMHHFIQEFPWHNYDDIIFVEKSIGTVLGHRYATELNIPAKHFTMTPLAYTFDYMTPGTSCYMLHGTNDSYMDTGLFYEKCNTLGFKDNYTVIEHANHSMEIGNVSADLANLTHFMKLLEKFASNP